MRIVVTGGAGNIGHHLCRHLVKNGHYVTSIDIQECKEQGVFSKVVNLLAILSDQHWILFMNDMGRT